MLAEVIRYDYPNAAGWSAPRITEEATEFEGATILMQGFRVYAGQFQTQHLLSCIQTNSVPAFPC
jgi:hypothetical protein